MQFQQIIRPEQDETIPKIYRTTSTLEHQDVPSICSVPDHQGRFPSAIVKYAVLTDE